MAEYLCEEDMNTGEYISRDEALKIFHQCCDNCTSSYNGVMCRACADAGAMDILIDIPAADVQPVKCGYWEEVTGYCGWGDTHYRCSVCGEEWYLEDGKPKDNNMNFCPRCGAKMIKDGDAE